MIIIIFAPPRTGKTVLMTHLLNETFYDFDRTEKMQEELIKKNQNGWKLTIPKHCVSANYDIKSFKFGYEEQHNRVINPFRLGFKNEYVKTHFNIPFEVIGITEAQKYLNSRMSMYFPDWQSRWYEQHGHNGIDIFLDTQRPMLIDVNIRELASFIEVMKLDIECDEYGEPCKLIWQVRIIENSRMFDRYISSGGKDKESYREERIVADYNVFDCYNSQSCKPKFYDGHFGEDFDYIESNQFEETIESYIDYLEKNDDEMPQGFYQKKRLKE